MIILILTFADDNVAIAREINYFGQSSRTYNVAIGAVRAIISAPSTTTSFPAPGGEINRVNPRRIANTHLCTPFGERDTHMRTARRVPRD